LNSADFTLGDSGDVFALSHLLEHVPVVGLKASVLLYQAAESVVSLGKLPVVVEFQRLLVLLQHLAGPVRNLGLETEGMINF